jgi:hypothetical protein
MRTPFCVVLLISMAWLTSVASDYQTQRKQQDIDRANYWKERGYAFNPQFMTGYAMDQKVKDYERASYWKERGYDFNAQFMTAYAMDQKVKDIKKARELNAKGYSFSVGFLMFYNENVLFITNTGDSATP